VVLSQTCDGILAKRVCQNMKSRVLAAFDKLILRKRSIIETINDQLKKRFQS
jgi:hypothetical protein